MQYHSKNGTGTGEMFVGLETVDGVPIRKSNAQFIRGHLPAKFYDEQLSKNTIWLKIMLTLETNLYLISVFITITYYLLLFKYISCFSLYEESFVSLDASRQPLICYSIGLRQSPYACKLMPSGAHEKL